MPTIFTYILLYASNLFYILLYTYIEYVTSVAFSPNGIYLATASGDITVNLLDIKSRIIGKTIDNIHEGKNNNTLHIYML